MKTIKCISLILGVVLLITSCATGKKAFQRGDYYQSVMEATHTLKSSPNNKKAHEALLLAYPLAKENGLRRINNAMMAGMLGRYMTAADEYIALNQLADAIYNSPRALEIIPYPESFSQELGSVLSLAAEEAYDLGESYFVHSNTMQAARDAYYYYAKANQYVYGYRDVRSKMETALWMATFKVVVTRPIVPPRQLYSADFFYNNLMDRLSQIAGDRFLRFYSDDEANRERLPKADHIIELRFEDFVVGAVRESKSTRSLSRDSVVVGTTTVNGRRQNVYGTVKATLEVYRREVSTQGVLSVRIVNGATNRVEARRSIPGKYVWSCEWATYRGDDRALSDKDKRMTNVRPLSPPSRQDLFMECTKPIYDQTVSFLRSHYSRYQ